MSCWPPLRSEKAEHGAHLACYSDMLDQVEDGARQFSALLDLARCERRELPEGVVDLVAVFDRARALRRQRAAVAALIDVALAGWARSFPPADQEGAMRVRALVDALAAAMVAGAEPPAVTF
jgi:hypothetical protein